MLAALKCRLFQTHQIHKLLSPKRQQWGVSVGAVQDCGVQTGSMDLFCSTLEEADVTKSCCNEDLLLQINWTNEE